MGLNMAFFYQLFNITYNLQCIFTLREEINASNLHEADQMTIDQTLKLPKRLKK